MAFRDAGKLTEVRKTAVHPPSHKLEESNKVWGFRVSGFGFRGFRISEFEFIGFGMCWVFAGKAEEFLS